MFRYLSFLVLMSALAGCWGSNWYIVEGTVVELMDDGRVMVDHEEIEGFMDAMTMPFAVSDPSLLEGVKPGDRIVGRLVIGDGKAALTKLRVTATTSVVVDPKASADLIGSQAPVRSGEYHLPFTVKLADGTTAPLGKDQGRPTALTYIYTTCPMPDFCPAIVARLQKLQPLLEGTNARILALTIDPTVDTDDVLTDYAKIHGAAHDTWQFGRAGEGDLEALSSLAGMPIRRKDGKVMHAKRLLVLSEDGRLIERYDDERWPVERVAQQLKTGSPAAPPNTSGTLTPE